MTADGDAPASPILLTIRQLARTPIDVLLRDRLTVGRDCDGFLLADARASRRHAVFVLESTGAITVTDLDSSNGTLLNDTSIRGEHRVVAGDVISLGTSEILVGGPLTSFDGAPVVPHRRTDTTGAPDRPLSTIMRLSESVESADVRDQIASQIAVGAPGEGTFTIVFTDIENSTTWATRLGDTAWMAVLETHNRLLRQELGEHGGREIKSQGDGFMLSFESARGAVSFAIAVQRSLAEHRHVDPDWPVQVRLGVHTGEALRSDDGDLFGRHVIIASRIADQADGGEILVSSLVRELTHGKNELRYEEARTLDLKGIGAQVAHSVAWR